MCELWRFETKRFAVILTAEPEQNPDLSWADPDTLDAIDNGRLDCVTFIVSVELDGRTIATDCLGNSVYADLRDFAKEHRAADPMQRNCEAMRAAHGGNAVICSYFPSMVREAISEARKALGDMPALRA